MSLVEKLVLAMPAEGAPDASAEVRALTARLLATPTHEVLATAQELVEACFFFSLRGMPAAEGAVRDIVLRLMPRLTAEQGASEKLALANEWLRRQAGEHDAQPERLPPAASSTGVRLRGGPR